LSGLWFGRGFVGRKRQQPDHVRERRRLKKQAAFNYGYRTSELEWRDGVLYFKQSGRRVPNVREVRKP
jgi:hypothetical protein